MTTAPATIHPVSGAPAFVPQYPTGVPSAAQPRTAAPSAVPPQTRASWGSLSPSMAAVGAVTAIAAILIAHLATIAAVDPVSSTLSMYGLNARSSGLFALSCLCLGGACLALAHRLPLLGRVSAYAAAAMLVLVVAFPTDPVGVTLTLSAQIHRYAAGAAFVLLAIMILSALRRCGTLMRRGVWICTAVVLLMFALTVAAAFWPDFLAMDQWRGVPQRVLLLVEAGVVGALGVHLHRTTDRRGPQWGA